MTVWSYQGPLKTTYNLSFKLQLPHIPGPWETGLHLQLVICDNFFQFSSRKMAKNGKKCLLDRQDLLNDHVIS